MYVACFVITFVVVVVVFLFFFCLRGTFVVILSKEIDKNKQVVVSI